MAIMAFAASPVVAKTESCFCNDAEWHCGHSGVVPERTRVSNWWPQSAQAYSKIGMMRSHFAM
jgi:hypothetical protein